MEVLEKLWKWVLSITAEQMGQIFMVSCISVFILIALFVVLKVFKWVIDEGADVAGKIIKFVIVGGFAAFILLCLYLGFAPIFHLPIPEWMSNVISTPQNAENNSGVSSVNGVCWTYRLENYYGNRAQVWQDIVNSKVGKLTTWEEFKKDVVTHNPQLETDGYIFNREKTYILPTSCR